MLARRHRARVFGARLTLRLLVRFAALAVVPGLIVYAVSVHVPHALDRVVVRRQGRRRARRRHQPRPASDRADDGRAAGQGERDGARARRPAAAAACRATRAPARAARHRGGGGGDRERAAARERGRRMSPGWCPSCPPAMPCARRVPSAATPRSMRPAERRSRCAWWCRVDMLGVAECALPAAAAERAAFARAQCGGGRGRIPRLPRAGDLARRAEAHLYRDAELRPADGAVRRGGRGRDPVRFCWPSRSPISRRRRRPSRAAISRAVRRSPAATSSASSPSPSTR